MAQRKPKGPTKAELEARIKRLQAPLKVTADTPVHFEPDASSGGTTGKLVAGEGDGQKSRAFDGTVDDLYVFTAKLTGALPMAGEPVPEPEPPA